MSKEWISIDSRYCGRCIYNKRGKSACPIRTAMNANPNDVMASQLIRDGKCTQFVNRYEV